VFDWDLFVVLLLLVTPLNKTTRNSLRPANGQRFPGRFAGAGTFQSLHVTAVPAMKRHYGMRGQFSRMAPASA
jgi:hypothetical protein